MPRHNDEVPDDAEDRETYDEEEDDPEDDDEEEEDEEDDNVRFATASRSAVHAAKVESSILYGEYWQIDSISSRLTYAIFLDSLLAICNTAASNQKGGKSLPGRYCLGRRRRG